MQTQHKYFNTDEASKYMHLSKSTLSKMRLYGTGPKFLKAGKRSVLYSIDEIDNWLASRSFINTSQYKKGGN